MPWLKARDGEKKHLSRQLFLLLYLKRSRLRFFETFQKYFLGKLFPNIAFFQRKKVPKLKTKKYYFKNYVTVLSSDF